MNTFIRNSGQRLGNFAWELRSSKRIIDVPFKWPELAQLASCKDDGTDQNRNRSAFVP